MRSILTALQEGRLFELPDAGKERALEFLARILDANPDIEVGTDVIEEVKMREHECNTGIGLGVGVPHIRAKREEGELYCAIGWSPQGIDYGAADNKPVHLVLMYYIPGAQKNVYLKEISSVFKAVKKTGGIEPIVNAPDLNGVRNLMLDWVGGVMGDAGPEAVARMIKLEVRQAQAITPAAPVAPAGPALPGLKPGSRIVPFTVLVAPPSGIFVLTQDADCMSALEKETTLAAHLAAGVPFSILSSTVVVTRTTPYLAGRTIYECVAFMGQ